MGSSHGAADRADPEAEEHQRARDRVDHACIELRTAAAALVADVAMVPERAASVADELDGLVASMTRLRQQLAPPIATIQTEQVRAALEPGEPLRLNIGPGPSRVDGWVHVDLADADVAADLRRPLPFPSNCASHIYASHVLEHLRHPDEAHAFLCECRRVLRRGGKVRIVVPDIGAYIRAYVEGDDSFWETRRRTWIHDDPAIAPLDRVLWYAGAGPADTDFFGHRHGYDATSLLDLMESAGLTPVRLCGFQQSRDEAFRIDDRSSVAHAEHNGRALSVFAEGFHLF